MTLTAPGCGMGPTIAADAQSKIMTIDGIDDAKVELVWEPAWNQDMISEEGKDETWHDLISSGGRPLPSAPKENSNPIFEPPDSRDSRL